MPTYNYTAVDARGKQATGTIEAADQNDAIVQIRQLGFYPQSLDEAPSDNAPAQVEPGQDSYYINRGNGVEGPFTIEFIEVMVLANQCAPDVPVQQVGRHNWVSLQSIRRVSLPAKTAAVPSETPSGGRRFLGALVFIVIAGGFGLFVYSELPSPPKHDTDSASAPDTAPAPAPSVAPAADNSTPAPAANNAGPITAAPPADTSSAGTTSAPAADNSSTGTTSAPDQNTMVKGSDGQYYSVPSLIYPELKAEKDNLDTLSAEIDKIRADFDAATADYKQLDDQYKALGTQIDSDRKTLDNTSQAAVDNFNAEVNSYNAQGTTLTQKGDALTSQQNDLNAKIDALNAKVDSFNAELARVGTLSH